MNHINRKAQLGDLQGIIITIVVVGLILGIGFVVLESFQDNQRSSSGTATKELITITDAGVYLANNYTTAGLTNCYKLTAITSVVNRSGTPTITAGNYSYDEWTGKIWNITSQASTGSGMWNVTYSYAYGGDSCGAIATTITATQTIPLWLSIIVILLIVGVLLALVFKVVVPSMGGGRGTTAEI